MPKDFIKLSAGDPDVEAPQYAIDAAIEKIKEGGSWTHYGRGPIPLAFREAVVDYYKEYAGAEYPEQNIIPTAGSSAALYLALRTVLNKGDEILMFNPTYRGHFTLLNGLGIKPNLVPLKRETGYHPDIDEIAEYITPKTKAVILCNPNNPSGTVFNEKELRTVGDLAVDHDMAIYGDEIYLHYVYDDNKFVSISSLDESYMARTINIMSFSKTFSMTGWRLGYIMVPDGYMEKASKIAGMAAPRPATFIYAAGTACLRGDFKYVEERHKTYDERRKYFCKAIDEIDGLECDLFEGSFYGWFDARSTGLGSDEFVERLFKAENVQLSSGATFGEGQDGMIRVPLVHPVPILKDCIGRIKSFMSTL